LDPNKCLKELRLLVYEDASVHTAAYNYDELAERFKALDEWIMNGGLLPADWEITKQERKSK